MPTSLILATQGRSDYAIIVAADAPAPEAFAAEELQRYLERISGVQLPIVRHGGLGDRQPILVGRGAVRDALGSRADDLLPPKAGHMPGYDAFVLETAADKVILAGCNPRATLYSVYAFLEELGCRWLEACPEGEVVPHRPNLAVEPLHQHEQAHSKYRGYYLYAQRPEAALLVTDWMAKNRMNVVSWPEHFQSYDEFIGPHVSAEALKRGMVLQLAHPTMDVFTPPPEVFAQHPDWMAEVNGQRCLRDIPGVVAGWARICQTNPEVFEYVVQRYLDYLEAHPEIDMVEVLERDGAGGFCDCEGCRQIQPRKFDPMMKTLSRTEQYLYWAKRSMARIHEHFPDKVLAFSVYYNQELPPSDPELIPQGDNVLMWLSTTWFRCLTHSPTSTTCANATYYRELDREWRRLYDGDIWVRTFDLYPADFGKGYFYPMYHRIAESLRFFRDNIEGTGAISFWEACEPLNNYIFARALWDTELDVEATLRDVIDRAYGPAAPAIHDFQALVGHFPYGQEDCHAWRDAGYLLLEHLTPERLAGMDAALGRAAREVSSEQEEARVQRLRDRFEVVRRYADARATYQAWMAALREGRYSDADAAKAHLAGIMEVNNTAHNPSREYFLPWSPEPEKTGVARVSQVVRRTIHSVEDFLYERARNRPHALINVLRGHRLPAPEGHRNRDSVLEPEVLNPTPEFMPWKVSGYYKRQGGVKGQQP